MLAFKVLDCLYAEIREKYCVDGFLVAGSHQYISLHKEGRLVKSSYIFKVGVHNETTIYMFSRDPAKYYELHDPNSLRDLRDRMDLLFCEALREKERLNVEKTLEQIKKRR